MTLFSFRVAYFVPLVSFTVVLLILVLMLKRGWAEFALDHPNQRSLHASPVPRTGGLALMAGVFAAWGIVWPEHWILLTIVAILFILSLWDDMCGLPVIWRFLAHFLAAGLFGVWYVFPAFGYLGTVVVILAAVWMTNLYNFMDGSDGLAGGMTLFGFGSYGLVAWLHGDAAFAAMCWSVAAASLAFLFFNFHPARLFMGDAGSIPLGFLAAVFGITGVVRGLWPAWFPVLVFSPFIVDASLTLVKRGLRGEKVWHAHREHYYQRLVQKGWGHRSTALAEYAVMGLAGLSSVAGALQPSWAIPLLIGWMILYAMLAVSLEKYFRRIS